MADIPATKPSSSVKLVLLGEAAVGKERFASLAPMYYRNAQSALVVYDITKPSSFVKAKHWVAELQRQASPGIVIALVGNKLDLTNEVQGLGFSEEDENNGDKANVQESDDEARKVSTAEAKAYAEEEGLLIFETSAKLGTNVATVFTAIANAIPETSLKGTRGSGVTQGNSTRREDQTRVTLTDPRVDESYDGCMC